MTVKSITTITCDTPACGNTYKVEDASETVIAEREAVRAGWALPDSGVDDRCPECLLVCEPS